MARYYNGFYGQITEIKKIYNLRNLRQLHGNN